MNDWRARRKKIAVDAFGGKCCICNYNKCMAALSFHHVDAAQKDFQISKPKSWEKFVAELKKCILLCSNCHLEVHHGDAKVPLNAPTFDENLILGEIPKPKKNKKQIVKKESSIIVCSCGKILKKSNKCKQCFDTSRRKTERPSKEILEQLVWSKTSTEVGKMFGVSDKTIESWCKAIGVNKPSRGYWQKLKKLH